MGEKNASKGENNNMKINHFINPNITVFGLIMRNWENEWLSWWVINPFENQYFQVSGFTKLKDALID